MNAEFLFGALYVAFIIGGFAAVLVAGEMIFDFLYRFIPVFRYWWDDFCDGLPDWGDE